MPPRLTDSAEPAPSRTFQAERLRTFVEQILAQSGLSASDAEIMARHLIWADLHGIAALGVAKIPDYIARLQAGVTVTTDDDLVVAFQRGGFLVVDAKDAFGQVVGHRVMEKVIETARTTGVSAAVIRNTTSGGMLGYYASQAVEAGMIGLAVNNCPPLQAAPGGIERILGNQAFSIASPAGQHPPLVFDTATTQMSLARIHDYQRLGEQLPEGAALAADGLPTVDPVAALDGILLPMGGHRGFGLALLWEVLTGVLGAGETFSTDVGWPTDTTRPQGVSMLLLAVDPSVSMPYDIFVTRVDDLIDRIRRSRRIDPSTPTRLPGERGMATALERGRSGIPLPAPLIAKLREIGIQRGVIATLED